MKQMENMKHSCTNGKIQQKGDAADDELNKTYASECTLSEKEGKKTTSYTTKVWIGSLITVMVAFSASKTGNENIRRIITDCGTPTSIPYGSIAVNEEEGTKYGSKASVVCSQGYTSSKPEVTCQVNGRWSSVYCHVTDCGQTLPNIENGHSTLNEEQDTTFGATAGVTCAPGYQRNKPKISCQANGKWEDATCQPVDCGNPKIDNGCLEKDSTLFMSQASVKCDTGYEASQPKVTCTASGTWQPAQCYNVDDCASNPCQNGGECVDKVADYVCKCQRWYSGKNCEINEACINHKCQNGGSCYAKPDGGYYCSCPPHIDGNFCESPHSGY